MGAAPPVLQSPKYDNFTSTKGLALIKSAERAGVALRLTPAEQWKSGAAWFEEKQPVRDGFETEFRFQLSGGGGLGHGADGFAFVLQNSGPSAVAGRGAAGGFALGDGTGDPKSPGIANSIAVFFDTFRNRDAGDPSGNYVALCTNGALPEMRWPPPRLAATTKVGFRLKDHRIHTARIVFKPPVLSLYLDDRGEAVLVSSLDLASVVDPRGRAYVGFTASTGAGYENHDVLSWSFAPLRPDISSAMVSSSISYLKVTCMPEKNLCTPAQGIAESAGTGKYHVILPAHLEWGVSIPAPPGANVTVTDATGMICWDLAARGSEGCNGPQGNGTNAGNADFVSPDQMAGALVHRALNGKTWFSVNDRKGNGFADNEGYFEFDVEVK